MHHSIRNAMRIYRHSASTHTYLEYLTFSTKSLCSAEQLETVARGLRSSSVLGAFLVLLDNVSMLTLYSSRPIGAWLVLQQQRMVRGLSHDYGFSGYRI